MAKKIILTDDPNWKQPLIMGDPYADAMTPKLAQQKWGKEADAQREHDSKDLFKYANSTFAIAPDAWMKNAQMTGVSNMMTQPMWFSPLHTPQNWQIASKRREIYQWCRFFYENEPKVAAAIDFYSRFPMNGFDLECKDRKILQWFERHVVKKLNLNEQFKMISSEYFMLGDVFIHTDVQCEQCQGRGVDVETGQRCNHAGGTFKSLKVLNPDWMEVQQSILAEEPAIVMVPDEELKRIVFYKQPKNIYDSIPDNVKKLVIQNKPIPMSNRTISHLRHMPVPYGTYGSSLIRRLFTTLAYKTKIMTANWIVAERLILPIRVVKVGSDNRPAVSADIADIQQQISAVANDPNLTIVTHHNFEYEWYGASGKILQVTQEMEFIGKEILDGFMLNQSLLNGEMSGYQSAQVGVETLIRRIESWRHTLAEWCEENIFKPIAEMQGFVDEEESEEHNETVFLYPRIKWNDLNLKDKTQWHQMLNQLHDKQLISAQTLLEELNLDYDQEVKRMRYEQAQAGPAGAAMGAGSPMGDMGGAMAGGMGGPMGEMGGEMGGPMDAGMAGGAGMGADMAGGAGGMAPMAGGGKVMKKGKQGNEQQQDMDPSAMPMVKLTSIEQKMADILVGLAKTYKINPMKIRAQMPIPNPTGQRHYTLDFAIPDLKINVECDGEVWHSNPEQIQDDQERDHLLAQRGWTVLRFDDKVIEEATQAVRNTIGTYMDKAMRAPKVASSQHSPDNETKYFGVNLKTSSIDLIDEWDRYVASVVRHYKYKE